MAFQGREYIEYAEHLGDELQNLRANNKEHLIQAAYRSIVSRVYYGAFLEVRQFLGLEDTNFKNSAHLEIGNKITSANRRIGNALSELKRLRVKADYNKKGDVAGKDITSAIRNANNIINFLTK